MINKHRPPTRLLLHAVLIAGALLFSLPFAWMIGTSMMDEREMLRPGVHLLPEAPEPRARSPYLDTSAFPEPPKPRVFMEANWNIYKGQILAVVRDRIEQLGIDNPDGLDPDRLTTQVLHGVWLRVLDVVQQEKLRDLANVIPLMNATVTPEMINEVLPQVRRRLCLALPSVRTADFRHVDLAAGTPAADFWQPTSDNVRLEPLVDDGRDCGLVRYDFDRGERWQLQAVIDRPVPLDQIRMLALAMRQDETWHGYEVTVEAGGQMWRSAEPLHFGGTQWQEVLLKPYDPARYDPYQPHPWTWLEQVAAGSTFSEPGKMRITLSATKSSPLAAWYAKAAANYRLASKQVPMWRYAATSVALVVLNIVLMVLSSSLAAYAFARLQWPGRDFLFVLLLATLMIPQQVTLIPGFIIMKWLGWYNTLNPLWVGAAFGSAFSIFLLRQFMKGIPTDLEDAARIDGCGFLRIWWHIMLPLVKPTLAAIAVFTFIATWNDFMTPLIYLNDQRLYPLSLGLFQLQTVLGQNYAMMMAGSIMMTIPVIGVFFFAQKYFVQGITLTGIKG